MQRRRGKAELAERMLDHPLGSFNGHFLPIQSQSGETGTSLFGEGSEGSLPVVITSLFLQVSFSGLGLSVSPPCCSSSSGPYMF